MTRIRPSPFKGLLVSVRSVAEAGEALAGGAGIIDVKEPARGPLGCADAAVVAAIGAVVARSVPWTVACGELAAGPDHVARAASCHGDVPVGGRPPDGAKAGPAGLAAAEWRDHFFRFAEALPRGTSPIAVAYADWVAAAAPCPEAIIAAAAEVATCSTLLIDTFDKSGPALVDMVAPARLRGWLAAARTVGFSVALAGRLTLDSLPRAAAFGADVIAIRGAACEGGREGRVSRARVAAVRLCYGTVVRRSEPCQPTAPVPTEIAS